ncbi:TIM-barrel domain-containing protein [Marinoscillum sp. 108]|uniref:glycoside hydrolase family 31 protein n=1 Tax=Marinoscillum sp. 108 TaxID=2653151 RepID=UPI0012F04303|nr:TIM-barrel domain-containing protein [Marinoscillum sp. 108]VXD13512.1 Alpha-D-xyloside xylohydrolase [Marinoscillum sp. 108]
MNTLKYLLLFLTFSGYAQLQNTGILNEPPDISKDFSDLRNTYFLAEDLTSFDPATGKGTVRYIRNNFATRQAFDNMLMRLVPVSANEFPTTEYAVAPEHPFSIEFTSARTVRIRMTSGPQYRKPEESLMLVEGVAPVDTKSWKYSKTTSGHEYKSEFGRILITEKPWHVYIYDEKGKLLTQTIHTDDLKNTYTPVTPFSYVRRASDYSRSMDAVFGLSPGEKIFGCGESFQEFNKRGQKVILWTDDANGVQNETMYKPVPFYMSSRGYGVFMHHSTPITCDFGKYFSSVNSMMIGDDELDLFVFIGEPKDILDEYTDLTGKAPMPPLWSFGFWMSRITYFSEADGKKVASSLRKNKIPADVIHFDTGWFGVDWRCDYQFPTDRFPDAPRMITDFKKQGFEICLWQLPYFTPQNTLFDELVSKGLAVKDGKGNIPYEDAVMDLSNPQTVSWYQDKIASLLREGVGAIKVDFGEAAPANGIYHSGRTGFYEHNLYPLRYNKAVADITKEVTGYPFIWARSAWAGSQRYPVHWGGDAATSNGAMAATLRGGLSFGLSGFSFWSHDIGGFVTTTPEDLYRRWTPFGMLTSHVRSHGEPPTEPWEYGEDFMNAFRLADNMRYELMPYIYTQAKYSSENGLPMVRALFVEYPDDPGSWLVDDQYLFGSDILVAPLLENGTSREVYLPPGLWIDYQTEKEYPGGWHTMEVGEIPIVMLVRDGTILPHAKLAQTTKEIDWKTLELRVFSTNGKAAGLLYTPEADAIGEIVLTKVGEDYKLTTDPFKDKIKYIIKKSAL